MPETVYPLCAVTSMICAVLLLRAYRRQRTRLLLWSGLCFVLLALNNTLVFVDLIVIPSGSDLSLWRGTASLPASACCSSASSGSRGKAALNAFLWGATAMGGGHLTAGPESGRRPGFQPCSREQLRSSRACALMKTVSLQ